MSSNADIYITQAETFSVEVEASENLLEIIETEVKNECLKIDTKRNKCIKGKNTPVVYISLPDLTGVTISGSGNIYINETLTAGRMDFKISGSGDVYAKDLVLDNLTLKVSGSGTFDLSSTKIANDLNIEVSGSGDFNGLDFPTVNADIKVSGSGDCKVNISEYLKVVISGSGSVEYKGNPSIDQKVTGSGSIRQY